LSGNGLDTQGQLGEWESWLYGPPPVPSGLVPLDELLRRGGFGPGTFTLIGGRTQTRKSTLMLNMTYRMLSSGIKVGFVGLDEGRWSYIGKLMSVATNSTLDQIEANWPNPALESQYEKLTENFVMYEGYRPSVDDLTNFLLNTEVEYGFRPEVVFIDYISLMKREKIYGGGEPARIQQLLEDLQTWSNDQQVVLLGLHQINREGDNGEHPVRLQDFKFGGEEIADIAIATYRPARDMAGHLPYELAVTIKGDNYTREDWELARETVHKFRDHTVIQLLKNRPGTKTCEEGLAVRSDGESLRMEPDTEIMKDHDRLAAFGE
jgi:KaiC/GvpD/RAD55 family RecA-like ATPase